MLGSKTHILKLNQSAFLSTTQMDFGYFVDFHERTQKNFTTRPRNLTILLIFGDSIGKYFYESIKKTSIWSIHFKKCKLTYTWTYVKLTNFNYTEAERYDNKISMNLICEI